MKGKKELLTVLNSLLADELTVINQYILIAPNRHGLFRMNWL